MRADGGDAWRSIWWAALVIAAAAAAPSVSSAELTDQQAFDIPSLPLDAALLRFSGQAGWQITTASDQLRGMTSRTVAGTLSVADALALLLRDSGLSYRRVGRNTIAIGRFSTPARNAAKSAVSTTGTLTVREPGLFARTVRRLAGCANAAAGAPCAEGADAAPLAGRVLEEVVVTGSRISRRDFVSASPIVTVTDEQLTFTGSANVETGLNLLPQFVPGQGAHSNPLLGGGRATLNLRGLGEQRNLVLLDGRRLPASNALNVVDVNLIPTALLQGVEVITGGASAVYGSDAISGVVNFRTVRDLRGLRFELRHGAPFAGDGGESAVSATFGSSIAGGRGSALVSLSLTRNGELLGSDRAFYRYGIASGNLASGVVQWSTNQPSQSAIDSIFTRYGQPPGAVARLSNVGFNDDGTLFAVAGGANLKLPTDQYGLVAGNVAQYTAPHNTVLQPQRRFQGFAKMDYAVGENITAYAQALQAHTEARNVVGYTLTLPPVSVPSTHPFIPADLRVLLQSRPVADAPFVLAKRFQEAPKRYVEETFDAFQTLAGLRGHLPHQGWDWDVYASHDETRNRETLTIGYRMSRLQALLDAPDAGQSLCRGGYNPFGIAASATISSECLAYLSTALRNRMRISQDILEASLRGSLLQLPADALRFALTASHRANRQSSDPDPLLVPPILTATASDIFATGSARPSGGSTRVDELALELLIPLLKDRRWARSLNIDAGYRHSDYDTSGGVSTAKLEGDWRPLPALMIRGGYERAIRAPNIGELFAALNRTASNLGFAPSAGDPCDARFVGRDAALRDLCLRTGVPAAIIDSFTFNSSAVGANQSGNPALKPEVADTYTAGVVWSPERRAAMLSRVSLSLDYYSITLRDAISTLPGNTTVNKCYNLDGSNPSYSALNAFCSAVRRNPGTGLITDVSTPYLNIGSLRTRGVDLQFDIGLDLDVVGLGHGELTWSTLASYLREYEVQSQPGGPFQDFAGTIGTPPLATWKWVSTLGYASGPLQLTLRWRHLSAMDDDTLVTRPATPSPGVPAYDQLDLLVRWSVHDAWQWRAGITNLTDRSPLAVGGVPGVTLPGLYDVAGRAFHVGLQLSL